MKTFEECYEGIREKLYEASPVRLLRTPVMFVTHEFLGYCWFYEPFWMIRERIKHLDRAGQGTDAQVVYDLQKQFQFDLLFILTDGGYGYWDYHKNPEHYVFVTNQSHAIYVKLEMRNWRLWHIPLLIVDRKTLRSRFRKWLLKIHQHLANLWALYTFMEWQHT